MDHRKVIANQALRDLFAQFLAQRITEDEFMRIGARIISWGLSPEKIPEELENLLLDPGPGEVG